MLVYDGKFHPVVSCREDQDAGTDAERLIEYCGRICYDSYGRGRSSVDYHSHIKEVGHGSVWEHFNVTIRMDLWVAWHLMCKPGVWIEKDPNGQTVRVTYNPRVPLHWLGGVDSLAVRDTLLVGLVPHIPQVVGDVTTRAALWWEPCEAETEEEKWVSIKMTGSRGFSHEQVRHGDRTAISQRSTRYVDESSSDWIVHPLLEEYFAENYNSPVNAVMGVVEGAAKRCYEQIVAELEPWLLSRGLGKTDARKQARGAARGWLGNALPTEMVFSASVAQWKRMITQRVCGAADAEIQQVYRDQVIPALEASCYGSCFCFE